MFDTERISLALLAFANYNDVGASPLSREKDETFSRSRCFHPSSLIEIIIISGLLYGLLSQYATKLLCIFAWLSHNESRQLRLFGVRVKK
jgi:hypothetical protein